MSTYIIAEAGVNHNGSLDLAKQLVDAAKDCGVDCIKFQTFIAENIVSKQAEKANYQKSHSDQDETQFEMLKHLELSFDEFIALRDYCHQKKIDFLSTGFDFESVRFLEGLDLPIWKIPSGEITNLPYLMMIAQINKPVILSTGMSTMEEIRNAIEVLKTSGAGEISLLQCTTEYPAPFAEINLKAIESMRETFHLNVGYSDHTEGIEASIAAVALGATIIEKHFTLDRNLEGPDHKASLEPTAMKAMVDAIRHIEVALGDGVKRPTKSEMKNIIVARKSILANREIKTGEIYTTENITVKRPGTGISPLRWFEVLGQRAIRDFKKDEFIEL